MKLLDLESFKFWNNTKHFISLKWNRIAPIFWLRKEWVSVVRFPDSLLHHELKCWTCCFSSLMRRIRQFSTLTQSDWFIFPTFLATFITWVALIWPSDHPLYLPVWSPVLKSWARLSQVRKLWARTELVQLWHLSCGLQFGDICLKFPPMSTLAPNPLTAAWSGLTDRGPGLVWGVNHRLSRTQQKELLKRDNQNRCARQVEKEKIWHHHQKSGFWFSWIKISVYSHGFKYYPQYCFSLNEVSDISHLYFIYKPDLGFFCSLI